MIINNHCTISEVLPWLFLIVISLSCSMSGKMVKVNMRYSAAIATNTMTKLRRYEEVSITVLIRICNALNAIICDVMDLIPEK